MILWNLVASLEDDGLSNPPHPVISHDAQWTVVLLILCAAIILAALIVGPIVRANTRALDQDERH